ncbi:glycosyltransferase [Rhodoplanes roseus]|uniref:Glycosyl transferase family 1 n=1 Tax=Rhodoplanes roseus TaxID=29409 RepID=A0A327KPQ1_9BRAD|nr:glycosyltransferase [Rhodoplanes roseus]RAI40361.1 glycosyl transferase family 1 [Rhodoplanes roseus]
MSENRRLRVLSIAHPAVSRDVGRRRYYPLATRDDLDVHLVVPATWHQFGRTTTADPPDDPGVTVHVMPIRLPKAGPMGWYLHFYPGLRKLIRRLDPDVIHLWEEPWSVVALQACLLKGRAALVMEVDQNILKTLPPPFESIRRHVLRNTAHVLSRSPDATAVVRARGYTGPVSPIGYGVDLDTFRPAAEPRRSGTSALRLGYVGRLVEEKGLDDALDAMTRARADITLSILGEGPYEPRLRERIAALGLTERVDMRGWASPAEVARFMHGLDALILLTRTTKAVREQFGRVIVEAQSCGVPVIGSTCGAIPDVIGDGGWVVPESDPATLATTLDSIAGAPPERAEKSAGGRGNVLARFTYDAVAQALATSWIAAAAETNSREKSHKNGSSGKTTVSHSYAGNE